jgi:hypothetical protein
MTPSRQSPTTNGFTVDAGLLAVCAGSQLVAFDLALPTGFACESWDGRIPVHRRERGHSHAKRDFTLHADGLVMEVKLVMHLNTCGKTSLS